MGYFFGKAQEKYYLEISTICSQLLMEKEREYPYPCSESDLLK